LITEKSYASAFKAQLAELDRSIGSFVNGAIPPPEESVHRLRASIRKSRATYTTLPKSAKKKNKNLRSYIKACRAAYRALSAVRDIDVVRSRIADWNKKSDSITSSHPDQELIRERISRLSTSMSKVTGLNFVDKPDFTIKTNDKEIEKEFKRSVKQLKKKVRSMLPVVLESEDSKKELHALRKSYKRLRYTLQLDPKPSPEVEEKIKALKERQAILGSIHDSDIVLDFLRKESIPGLEVDAIIKAEEKVRHKNYISFVHSCKDYKF
jgi:CHAD domain-containing protein